MTSTYLLIASIFIICLLSTGGALECYQCTELEHNHRDCTHKTTKCETFQDACTSYVRWAVPSANSARGRRIYYISKDCDTRVGCARRQAAERTACKRDWYNDWACTDCCEGDLCNYYVTLAAGTTKAHTWFVCVAMFMSVAVTWSSHR